MECVKWEETGLLYSAKELDLHSAREYESHLAICSSCSAELAAYTSDKNQFFRVELLADAPSHATDAEILRVASQPIGSTKIGFSIFSPFFRRASVALMLLVVGFGGSGYFVYMAKTTAASKAALAAKTIKATPVVAAALPASVALVDTTKDSIVKSKPELTNVPHVGNMNAEGVITVKETKE